MSGFVFMASVILFFFSAYRLKILGSWFRVLGIVLSTLLVSSLLLAFLNLPVRPEPFAGILGLFSVAMLYHSSRKKSGSRTDARTDRLSKDAIVALIAVLICFVAGVVYFRQDFLLPQYISIDAAVHFMLGKYVSTNDTLLVFQRDLFFPDSPHIAQYPFGAGVLFSLFSEILFFLPALVSFQIFHIFLLAVTSGYFIFVFLSRLHITSVPLRMLAVLMISLGGFFNLMIMGFTSQLAGVFFLIFLYDVYTAYRAQIGTIVLAALAIFSVFATYLYWIPVVFLFLAAQTVLAVDFRAIGTSLKKLAVPVGSGLLAILLALPYAYEVVSSGLLGVAGNDGGAYKVFLLNFVLYLPLLIAALPFFVREFFVKRSSAISFLASAVVFTCVLAAMFYSDNASGYAFSKSFMLTLPAPVSYTHLTLPTIYSV